MAWLNFMVGGGFLAWQTLWGGDFLFKVRGLGSLEVGSLLFAFSLAALLGFLLCGPLADRWGLPRVLSASGSPWGPSCWLYGRKCPHGAST